MANASSLTGDFLKKASTVASHYGFAPLSSLMAAPITEPKRTRPELPDLPETVRRDPFGSHVASILEHYAKTSAGARKKEPTLVYHATLHRRAGGREGKRTARFGLAVLGCPKSIGEALIIKTSLAILEELGVKNATVHVNSVGDRDSAARFARELTVYLRRHLQDLSPACQQALKRDPFEALESIMDKSLPLCETMPRPLHFLTESSRRHLREVLEFLELEGVPYAIEDKLIGHRDCYSQTLFEIRRPLEEPESMQTLVRGGRCDELAKKNFRSSVPVVGAVFEHSTGAAASLPAKLRSRQPKFFLIQLGFSAKLLSLSVLESLRKAHISVHQTINNDSLRDQLEVAQKTNAPYLIIMGQREAIDRTVIVRNVNSQAQEIVPISILSDYLKTSLRI